MKHSPAEYPIRVSAVQVREPRQGEQEGARNAS